MIKILSIVVLLSFQLSFSQSKFEKMPEGTNEIHFTYKQNSKIFIDESGVYADSLFFKKNFPKMKVINVNNSDYITEIYNFINFSKNGIKYD